MATHREAQNPSFSYVDPAPWPKDQPKVDEVGTTSAPLKSISFFFGEYCRAYNEDFMLCKNEDRHPEHCLREGRRVTRCAQDLYVVRVARAKLTGSIAKVGEKCGKEWDAHWQCLERNNHEFFACREAERPLNKCVLEQLNLRKTIPGTPKGKEPIHEKKSPYITRLQK